MNIVFTLHAIRRIEERGITLSEVYDCLVEPHRTELKNGQTVYMKKSNDSKWLLILPCILNEAECKILTAIRTSKIDKYL